MKMLQKIKNGQKSAKIGKYYEKSRFSLQQLPQNRHFLKEMHQKKNATHDKVLVTMRKQFRFKMEKQKQRKSTVVCNPHRRQPNPSGPSPRGG